MVWDLAGSLPFSFSAQECAGPGVLGTWGAWSSQVFAGTKVGPLSRLVNAQLPLREEKGLAPVGRVSKCVASLKALRCSELV